MERRRSLPRTSTNGSAVLNSHFSDTSTSPLRRKSISFGPNIIYNENTSTNSPTHSSSFLRPPNSTLHRTSNTSPSPLHKKKPISDSPTRLQKQHSSEDLQSRGLWPSSKKLNPSADAEADIQSDASAGYNISTFSSRQREEKGNSSLRYQIGKIQVERSLSKPGTVFNDSGLARKSMNSELSENIGLSPRLRRPQSPAQRPRSPANEKSKGVGSFISQGFNNIFRRKSFQGLSGELVVKPIPTAVNESPGKDRSTTVKRVGSPSREMRTGGSPVRITAVTVADGETLYKLKIIQNYLIQWRFVNAGMVVVNQIKCENAERMFVNSWLGLSDLRTMVAKNKSKLEKEKFKFKLSKLLYHQTKALERWGTMERLHLAALSSTTDSLQGAVCRLPITDLAKVDLHLLSISLQHATDIADAVNGNIANYHYKVLITFPLIEELAQVVASEKHLLEECIELLGLVSTLQVHEESLRSHVIQLKSQQLMSCSDTERRS